MTIDVTACRLITPPADRVADDYAVDFRNDAAWSQGIRTAELTRQAEGEDGGFGVGAEVTRTAYFPRRRIDYVPRWRSTSPSGCS